MCGGGRFDLGRFRRLVLLFCGGGGGGAGQADTWGRRVQRLQRPRQNRLQACEVEVHGPKVIERVEQLGRQRDEKVRCEPVV